MSQAQRVSIVTPTYNSAAYLASTIESVRAQTFVDWELVLIDDGSSDNTVEISKEFAKQDKRIRVVQRGHCGTAAARNNGFQETCPAAEFIAFLDHDDIWEPRALEQLIDALDRHPECPAAHGLARCIDMHGRRVEGDDLAERMRHRQVMQNGECADLPISMPTSFEAELVLNYVVTPGTSLVRRHVLESVGGFEASAVPADDWDMNLRIARHGGFALVDDVILNWRRHPNAFSYTTKRYRRAHLIVLQRTVQSTENTPLQRKAALSALYGELRSLHAAIGQTLKRRQVRAASKALVLILLYYRLMGRLVLISGVSRVARAR